ncbi:hypothetical protein A3B33_02800 [Candidatus Adlerbacteria bacterium RIFCSPLOWO2_01_FULL_54_16]|uniref:Peptidoglycan binding-like domain-containing protein n=1 Tax=Candidatus Adlerbacteria bacterium RIFCSPLOWO2_01_FULL_54_16 TaxID=1797244 RepID=A0A1F4Y075_9BACT|nr:MAG: hypothetical protein A3B33_02800 [Candidatus Adlerbacteria bacterium RIFCSPLOWO2_01_FULL_54_16]
MTITNSSTRLVALATGVAVALALMGAVAIAPAQAAALTQAQIQSIVSLLASFGADSATIANVTAALQGQATPGTGGSAGACPALSRDLQQGSSGADVKALQVFLNGSASTQLAVTGAGSPGNESIYFGPITKAAAMKFQAANNVAPVAGYVGPITRAAIAAVCGTTPSPTPTPTPTPGTGVSVSAAIQPMNGLAPDNANRIPFTNFTLTAGNDGDVTINSITVERQGAANDAIFAGVVLLDASTGAQVGIARTLNSNHQATIGDTVVIPRGTSKTFTVAGNRADTNSHAGEVASLAVVAVNTSAAVSGSLPITGASHTVNETLSIGTISTTTSAFDPAAAQTKNLGDTAVRFTGQRFTAGSAEDLKLHSLRWRQVGTVGPSDLANVQTLIDGTVYPTTVDSSGKYYTSVFPGGISIPKGNTIDIHVRGDIVGANSASRTVDFDIDKSTDIYFVGQTYGFGIGMSHSTSTPWTSGYVTTINAATVNLIGKAAEVPAQNIAVQVANQPLGGFVTDFKGEGVTMTQMIFNISYGTNADSNASELLTSISIVDENGKIVAGPVDASASGGLQVATFSDSVTFPTGRHVFSLKGKLPSTVSNNQTVSASTTPSGWSGRPGAITGNTISITQGNFSMNTMTVKTGSVTASVSGTPAAQNVVAGVIGFTAANIIFDAGQSGEDVRFNSAQFRYTDGMTTDVSNCVAYDGSQRLNDTSVNPSSTAAHTFTFDTALVVPKGTTKTVAIKCDIPGSATASDTFAWGVTDGDTISGTGIGSGSSIAASITTGGNTMTIAGSGALTVSRDASAPSYTIAVAGVSNSLLNIIRFDGTNEDQKLDRVALEMANGASTSTPSNINKVTLWDGATKVGEAIFTSRYATSTIGTCTGCGTVTIPANGYKVITVKGDLAGIGTGQATTTNGLLLEVEYDGNDTTGTRSIGQASGTTINQGSATDTDGAGIRIFRDVPTVAQYSSGACSSLGTLITGTAQAVHCFSVTASNTGNPNGIGLYKFTVNVATSANSAVTGTTSVENLDIYAYTDSAMSQAVSGYTDGLVFDGTDGQIIAGDNSAVLSSVLQVPAGSTYYFKVVLDVALTAGTGTFSGSLTTKLVGDAAYPHLGGPLTAKAATVDGNGGGNDDFIWSPNATTTSTAHNLDWTNGYGISGLPSAGLSGQTLSK